MLSYHKKIKYLICLEIIPSFYSGIADEYLFKTPIYNSIKILQDIV